MRKIIAIIGSRRRNSNYDFILVERCFLDIYEEENTIVSGGCQKGGDRFAEMIAKKYDVPIKIFKAHWSTFGRAAGFIRNTDIAKCGTEVIACVASDRTGGTEDTIKKFKKFHPKGVLHIV